MVQVLSERISEIQKQIQCKDNIIREMELRLSNQDKLHMELMNVFHNQMNNNCLTPGTQRNNSSINTTY